MAAEPEIELGAAETLGAIMGYVDRDVVISIGVAPGHAVADFTGRLEAWPTRHETGELVLRVWATESHWPALVCLPDGVTARLYDGNLFLRVGDAIVGVRALARRHAADQSALPTDSRGDR